MRRSRPQKQGGEGGFQQVLVTGKEKLPSEHIRKNGLCPRVRHLFFQEPPRTQPDRDPSGILSMAALAYITHRTHGRWVWLLSAPAGGRSPPDQRDFPRQPECAEHLPGAGARSRVWAQPVIPHFHSIVFLLLFSAWNVLSCLLMSKSFLDLMNVFKMMFSNYKENTCWLLENWGNKNRKKLLAIPPSKYNQGHLSRVKFSTWLHPTHTELPSYIWNKPGLFLTHL